MKGQRSLPVVVLLAAGLLTGCGSSTESAATGGSKEPLKIALVPPTGGTLDQMGQAATRGWEYAAAEVNAKGGVDGHKVESCGPRPTSSRRRRCALCARPSPSSRRIS